MLLRKMLTENVVRLDVEGLSTPQEVIEYSGRLLADAGKTNEAYVKGMVDAYNTLGAYMVMAPGLAMPHARPDGNVKEPCISFVKLKEPVNFHHPCNDPVKIVFALGGVSDDGHIDILKSLSSLLAADHIIERLSVIDTYEELMKLIEKEVKE
ncbi:MAG: PTS sugar transporter subunit IIA [Hespellia sp.]|nr:PTS sugar transporter subunit IIA [Hespellia sp.]